MLVARLLDHLVSVGSLTVIDADGNTHLFRGMAGPAVTVRLHDGSLHRRLFFDPSLGFGEAYMDGRVSIVDSDVYGLLELIGINLEALGRSGLHGWKKWLYRLLRRVRQFNPVGRARVNAAHHYDLTGALYELFLDSDKQYSCAYFTEPGISLERAQAEKKRLIAAKLLLKPGMTVLDIGCGWGGLAFYLAKEFGVDVTGLTLSAEQQKTAEARAREQGLADCVRFHLRDYREQTGAFDRIVSVGMFEHVGIDHYNRYFSQIHDLLKPDGVALLHTIGRLDGPGVTDPWIDRYIFPRGYIPALSEVMPAIEKNRLWTTDVEVLRLHYAETLRHWRRRFARNRDKAKALYDERFCRMWEYYLAVSEVSFRHLATTVFQIQLARRQDTVPLTRDYIFGTDEPHANKTVRRHGSRAA
ncbi:MAG: class I SAM-dependent methyltransferase [Rhodospirillales bacterium]